MPTAGLNGVPFVTPLSQTSAAPFGLFAVNVTAVFSQTVWSTPAPTIGSGFTVTST